MTGQASGRVDPLHQNFERHVLVLERRQGAGPHLCQQLRHSWVPVQIDPEHQVVDEEAHELIKGCVTTPGDRETNGHI
nr:hypothetical protein CPGR_06025 [Mycolicibacterium fortuitum subsp. fortuitum DSM 46621 = ATCC 6841 = JCM 6387]